MIIPKEVKIGRHKFEVLVIERPWACHDGEISYYRKTIKIAKRSSLSKLRRSNKAMSETFWHEVTHGILFDMDHELWNDEKFVTAFSKRLNNVVEGAKL